MTYQMPPSSPAESCKRLRVKRIEDADLTLKDAVMLSTAVPGVFGSMSCQIDKDLIYGRLVDGSHGSTKLNNCNPTLSLVQEALRHGYKRENIKVISIGAGAYEPEAQLTS